ncbi:Bifunctional uridylyltransferase/uridylyl-removing enzyme, partial [Clarias magur]
DEKDLSRPIISSPEAAEDGGREILIWVIVPGKNISLVHLLSVYVKQERQMLLGNIK